MIYMGLNNRFISISNNNYFKPKHSFNLLFNKFFDGDSCKIETCKKKKKKFILC